MLRWEFIRENNKVTEKERKHALDQESKIKDNTIFDQEKRRKEMENAK